MRLLYIEDDPAAQQYIFKGLGEHGFLVEVVSDGASGVERATHGGYDLILLDVMLPDMEGFDVLRRLRQASIATPVLFLSARSAVGDRVRGLELGADDYLPKPFAFAELLARIRAIARRRLGEPEDGRLAIADLVLDLNRRTVERGGPARRSLAQAVRAARVPAAPPRSRGVARDDHRERLGLGLRELLEPDRRPHQPTAQEDRPGPADAPDPHREGHRLHPRGTRRGNQRAGPAAGESVVA